MARCPATPCTAPLAYTMKQDLIDNGFTFHPGNADQNTGRFIASDLPGCTPCMIDDMQAAGCIFADGGVYERPLINQIKNLFR